MVNLNFEKNDDLCYPVIKTAQRIVDAPQIGFEWEIPLEDGEEHGGPYGCHFWNKHGYSAHYECGGIEIASPVFPTIGIARAHAKWAIGIEKKDPYTCAEDGNLEKEDHYDPVCCGVHVHVTNKKYSKDKAFELASYRKALVLLQDIRDETAFYKRRQFIKDISGRFREGYTYEYTEQADINPLRQSTNLRFDGNYVRDVWDCDHQRFGETYLQGNMIRHNRKDSCSTMEFRIFGPTPDRLLVALEFAHSMFKYVTTDPRCLNAETYGELPTLLDWKAWVNKNKGYQTLKNDQPFINFGD